jgi:hypothetical protein
MTSRWRLAALIPARPHENIRDHRGGRANPNQLKEIIMFKNIIAIAVATTFGTAVFAQGTASSPAKPVEASKPAATAQVAAAPNAPVATAPATTATATAKPEVMPTESKAPAKPKAKQVKTAPATATATPAATTGVATPPAK